MKTELLKVNEESVALGARLIREGELVGFPTETVYGLGANALDARAVAKIFEAKGRPQDNPLITHVACVEEIPPLVRAIPAAARKLMEAFWPGPMTLILPKADCIPDAVSAGLDTVGIRLPANADARRLIRAAGCPIAAPSANRSGRPSPTTALHVLEDMDGRIPLILDGGACQVGVESRGAGDSAPGRNHAGDGGARAGACPRGRARDEPAQGGRRGALAGNEIQALRAEGEDGHLQRRAGACRLGDLQAIRRADGQG